MVRKSGAKGPVAEERMGCAGGRTSGKVDPLPVEGTPTRSATQRKGAVEGSTMRIIGLDLGNTISLCELESGNVRDRRVAGSVEELVRTTLGANKPKARVAIEACREAWHVHDVLTQAGHEVVLVDTTRARQIGIAQHGRKTNRLDAEVLARALAEERLPEAHLLSPERRVLRERVMVRAAMVETRARLIVTVRGVLRAHGVRVAGCSPSAFVSHARSREMEPGARTMIEPLCAMIEECERRIVEIETTLIGLAEREPVAQVLMSVPGVSLITAVTFISVIDEAKRFGNAHEVESYLGLVPGEFSTGDRRTLGGITRAGNSYLRTVLVQAAWSVLVRAEANDPLRRWAEQVAERRGKKVAVVALARRMAGVLWAMWRDGTYYDPQSVERSRERRDPERQRTLREQAPRRCREKLRRYGATAKRAPRHGARPVTP